MQATQAGALACSMGVGATQASRGEASCRDPIM